MLLGNLGAMLGGQRLTAQSYPVMPDVSAWDGIENLGYRKHSNNPAKWVDLTGNGHSFSAMSGTTLDFGSDHYIGDGTKYLTATLDNEVTEVIGTLEVVLQMDARGAWQRIVYETLMCLSSAGLRIAANTDSGEVGERGFSIKHRFRTGAKSILHMSQPTGYAFQLSLESPYSVFGTYLDGDYLGSNNLHVNYQNTTPGLIPLGYSPTGDATFKGKIYRVALHSKVLTAEEIAANYAVDKARFNLPDAK